VRRLLLISRRWTAVETMTSPRSSPEFPPSVCVFVRRIRGDYKIFRLRSRGPPRRWPNGGPFIHTAGLAANNRSVSSGTSSSDLWP